VIRFMAWQLVKALDLLGAVGEECATAFSDGQRDAAVPLERVKGFALPAMEYCGNQAKRVELSGATRWLDEQALPELRRGLTWGRLRMHAEVVRKTLESELTYRRFAFVPGERAKMLDELSKDWGAVWDRFDEGVKEDSTEAVHSYALGRHTACVFHLMRVAERGLRALARERQVPTAHESLEWEDWEKLLTGIRDSVKQIQLPRGEARSAALGFYNGALGEFEAFRDEFRNHVAHARRFYQAPDAARALYHVRDFMTRLAKHLNGRSARPIDWNRVAGRLKPKTKRARKA
jgi:hypothetical protein